MEPNGLRKTRKKVSAVQGNCEVNSANDGDELDPWTAWAYQPRTVSFLLIGACLLIWASGALDPENSPATDLVISVKRGVWAMVAVFLTYCLLQAPSTVLIRPHPAIWRLVHGLAVIYLVSLTFLLFQKRDDARQFMKFLHPDLGVELPERSYGADCRIYLPDNSTSRFKNVYDTLFDEFVLAHIFGWWGKAIMIRNQPLLWVLSIGFELMELTFRHMLPNFNECWWDSIILDILICNWFGIWAGMHTVRYFDGRTYEWVGISRQPNIIGKVKRTLGQFTPAQWDKDEWHPLLGPWRFIQIDFVVANCYTNYPGVQLIPAGQETSKKVGAILLALSCYMYSGTPYLYQVWPWSISQFHAVMVGNLLVICWGDPRHIFGCVVVAAASDFAEKEDIGFLAWYIIYLFHSFLMDIYDPSLLYISYPFMNCKCLCSYLALRITVLHVECLNLSYLLRELFLVPGYRISSLLTG
ncbi:hypothetical protein IFM89_027555 [Coptis chinensis]|uniref:CDP-diacylglycerol--serine O-phosphatidyltransferase n=1 Tax=Coptis chinensis TaxID=261450 RepID=A0A835LWW6_9MAGN|nr:hypothetical protein IFM89_027555 [Coptis chinensis]